MKSIFSLLTIICVLSFALPARGGYLTVRSHDEEVREQVEMLQRRYKHYLQYRANQGLDARARERYSNEIKQVRRELEAIHERNRERYIIERNQRPPREDEKWEALALKEQEEKARQMELNRQRYIRERDALRRAIAEAPHVDEAEEYDLKPRP